MIQLEQKYSFIHDWHIVFCPFPICLHDMEDIANYLANNNTIHNNNTHFKQFESLAIITFIQFATH